MKRWAAGCLAVPLAVIGLAAKAHSSDRDRWPASPAEVSSLPVVLLVDPGAGRILYARQHDSRFLPASVAKVMSAYVAFEEIARGRLRIDQIIPVSETSAREWSGKGTSLYLKPGERLTVDQLLHGIVTVSANDAAVVLAVGHLRSVSGWTDSMNTEARRLGMTNSHFKTPNGWPDNGATYVSASDLVKLAVGLIERHPALYHRYFGQKAMTLHGITQQSHDPTLGVVAGADGIKTGHTNEAGFNFLGSAQRSGRRLIMVIAGAKSEGERATASRALLEWGFSAWQFRPLFRAGHTVGMAQVQGGDARQVALIAPRAIHAAIPKEQAFRITLNIHYKGPLVAPVAKGSEVATLRILNNGRQVGSVPLLAGEAIGEAGPFDRLWNGLMGLFT